LEFSLGLEDITLEAKLINQNLEMDVGLASHCDGHESRCDPNRVGVGARRCGENERKQERLELHGRASFVEDG
jgi:hypothetical protein